MNRAVKAVLYVILLAAVSALAVKFCVLYKVVMRTSPRAAMFEAAESMSSAAAAPPAVSTNTSPATNEPGATHGPAPTNAATEANALAGSNTPGESNSLALTNLSRPARRAHPRVSPTLAPEDSNAPTFSTLMTYGVALFAVAVCLSVLLAHDFSHLVGERFHQFILSDDGETTKAPEYERAEQLWADGQPLEAVRLMRDYLKSHPRELYVAIRIAEIYEKDLANYLAAALEYEELLRHRLRPEQWGWAAIHLANLYSGKLSQTDKAIALLHRIVSEYGETAAAAKARARLSQLEGEPSPAMPAPTEIDEDPTPPSNLPKGFRPKKG